MTVPTLEQVDSYLHDHIPITNGMGVTVAEIDSSHVRLHAPLGPNVNHRETAFGGSIASVAILACWTMLWYRLRCAGMSSRLVVWKSQFEFQRPVESDFTAICQAPVDVDWSRFLEILDRAGRARMPMSSRVVCGGKDCAVHEGVYVGLKSLTPPETV